MTTKLGKDLQAGDTIEYLGEPHTIESFRSHPGVHGDSARIAACDGGKWDITLFDDYPYRLWET